MSQIIGYFSDGNPIYKDLLTKQSVFINCDFRHSHLSELDLKSISFFQCDFTSACFRESKITDIVFNTCVLDYIDAYSTQFIGVDFISVSMKGSLLTKSKFLVKNWYFVDLSYSKVFDMDMQETTDSENCILGYQHEVMGEPLRLLDGYFTVDMDSSKAAIMGNGIIKRITNSVIEKRISESKKIPKSLAWFLRKILGLKTFDEDLKNHHGGSIQKELDKIRKN